MDEDNLDSLFEDALNDDAESESTEKPADDDGKQAEEAKPAAPPKPPQDRAENARQAEGRRIREREQRAYQAARAEVSETLRRLGIENPDDGTTIDSVDALEAYEKALSDRRINSGNANADDVRRIVRETVQAPQQQSDAPQRELDMIRDMDPTMTDLGAILNSDIGPAFRQYVQQGASFTQAYGRALREKNARAEGASAAAAAKASSKGHLGSTSTRGDGAMEVPADEMALFRELCPDMTSAEIQRFYTEDRKKFGR